MNEDASIDEFARLAQQMEEDEQGLSLRDDKGQALISTKKEYLEVLDQRFNLLVSALPHRMRLRHTEHIVALPAPIYVNNNMLVGLPTLRTRFNPPSFCIEHKDVYGLEGLQRIIVRAEKANKGLTIQLTHGSFVPIELCDFSNPEALKMSDVGYYKSLTVTVPRLGETYNAAKIEATPASRRVSHLGIVR
jgi:hypothetical protein